MAAPGNAQGDDVDRAGPTQIFVSYSHADCDVMNEFRRHLEADEHAGTIRLWVDDTELRTGDLWRKKIEDAVAASEWALLLVSTSFLKSHVITNGEVALLCDRVAEFAAVQLDFCSSKSVGFLDEVTWLYKDDKAPLNGGLLDPAERDRRIRKACRQLVDDVRRWRSALAEPANHLRAAGGDRGPEATVTDPVFILHRLAHGGLVPLRDELDRAAAVVPGSVPIAWWRRWLTEHADVLVLAGVAWSGRLERAAELAPTLYRWMTADPSRPLGIDPDRLRSWTSHLRATGGRVPVPTTPYRLLTVSRTHAARLVAWSPDGTRVAAAGHTTVQVWDPHGARPAATLDLGGAEVTDLAWSPDSTRIATTGAGVDIWPAAGGPKRHDVVTRLTYKAVRVAWSPSGRYLAVGDCAGYVSVVEVHDGRTMAVRRFGTRSVTAVAWSPDGTRVAVHVADRYPEVRVWFPSTGETSARCSSGGPALAWSPTGTDIALARGATTAIELWGTSVGGPLRRRALARLRRGRSLTAPDTQRAVAWSPVGRYLAGGGEDGCVRLWNPVSGDRVDTLPGHESPLNALSWSPDGQRLASADDAGRVRVWDVARGEPGRATTAGGRSPDAPSAPIRALAWSPGCDHLVSTDADGRVRLWDAATGTVREQLAGPGPANAATWAPGQARLAYGDDDRRLCLRAVGDGCEETTRLAGRHRGITGITWSPAGTSVTAVVEPGSRPRRWDVVTGRRESVVQVENGTRQLAWSPTGAHAAVLSGDGNVLLVDATHPWGDVLVKRGHADEVERIAWSPDGTLLAVARPSGTELRQVPDGLCIYKSSWSATQLCWTPDRQRLAIRTRDEDVHFWGAGADDLNLRILRTGHGQEPSAIAWSPCGTFLATAGENGTVEIHDVERREGRRVRHRIGLRSATALAWSGDRIAVGGRGSMTLLEFRPTVDALVPLPPSESR